MSLCSGLTFDLCGMRAGRLKSPQGLIKPGSDTQRIRTDSVYLVCFKTKYPYRQSQSLQTNIVVGGMMQVRASDL